MKRGVLYGAFRVCGYALLVAAIVGVSSATFPAISFAAQKTFTCTPIDVAVFPKKRVHVRCSPADGAIAWFALGVSDAADANRVLSLVSTAFATKKKLTIWYDPDDLTGGSIGCNVSDCRLILGVRMF